MKNLIKIIMIIIMFVSFQSNAQQLDLGMSFIPTASTVNFDMENVSISTTLLAHANFSTKKTYHVLAYNFNGTSISTFHGWVYAPDQDVYLILAKNLKDVDGYMGIGWEHTVFNGGFSPSAFIEFGTNYHFSESYVSIGIFAPLNVAVWKKKIKDIN